MIDFVRTSRSEAETSLIGEVLGQLLRAGDVLLLDGTLGAGKTTLVRAVAASMGLDIGAVASPTFVVIHEYARPGAAKPSGGGTLDHPELIHVDAYRLRDASDLDSLGWDTVMARLRTNAAAVIEWAQRLGPNALASPEPARLRMEHIDETSRELNFTVPDSWRSRAGFAELVKRQPTNCPVTGARVEPDSPTYPFVNERARMADLYRWFSGSYTVSRDAMQSDFDEPERG